MDFKIKDYDIANHFFTLDNVPNILVATRKAVEILEPWTEDTDAVLFSRIDYPALEGSAYGDLPREPSVLHACVHNEEGEGTDAYVVISATDPDGQREIDTWGRTFMVARTPFAELENVFFSVEALECKEALSERDVCYLLKVENEKTGKTYTFTSRGRTHLQALLTAIRSCEMIGESTNES